MPYTLPRIGKALVKYFKPIRAADPHVPGDPNFQKSKNSGSQTDSESLKQGFKLLRFKKPARDPVAEAKQKIQGGGLEETGLELAQNGGLPERAPTQWLELVLHLVNACKRVGEKVKRKMGLESYRVAVASRGQTKLKTRGSIVNTTAENVLDDSEEAA